MSNFQVEVQYREIGAPSKSDKVRARKKVNHEIEAGRMVAQPCIKCGAAKAQAHHRDYSKPLDVEWLCSSCHSQLHNQKYPLTKQCAVCGEIFTPHKTKRLRAVTCSRKCFRLRVHATHSKLTIEKMIEIRRRYLAGGVTQAALAKEFECDRARIGQIVQCKASRIPGINERLSEIMPSPMAAALCQAVMQ